MPAIRPKNPIDDGCAVRYVSPIFFLHRRHFTLPAGLAKINRQANALLAHQRLGENFRWIGLSASRDFTILAD